MLKLTVEGEEYELDTEAMTVKEAKAIERFTGVRISQFNPETVASDVDQMTVMVWLARRRAGEPDLKLDDVDFVLSKVSVRDLDDPTDRPVKGDPPVPTVPTTAESPAGVVLGSSDGSML